MRPNTILRAFDDPEFAAYLVERRQARRRLFLGVLAVLAVVMVAVGWKVGRHFVASSWLSSNHFRVVWGAYGRSWMTGGYTSVKYIPHYNMSMNSQKVVDLDRLAMLHRVEELDLSNAYKLDEADLKILDQLPCLRSLNLERLRKSTQGLINNTRLTDSVMARIKPLAKLEFLNLNGQAITDAGVAQLIGMTRLEEVELRETAITDAGLELLVTLPNLRSLDVTGANVTSPAIAKFQAARPDLRIIEDSAPASPLKPSVPGL
jgi:hypothetical protein